MKPHIEACHTKLGVMKWRCFTKHTTEDGYAYEREGKGYTVAEAYRKWRRAGGNFHLFRRTNTHDHAVAVPPGGTPRSNGAGFVLCARGRRLASEGESSSRARVALASPGRTSLSGEPGTD